jgi:hypothetical protein
MPTTRMASSWLPGRKANGNPARLKTGATGEKAGCNAPRLLFAATSWLQLRRHFLSQTFNLGRIISSAPELRHKLAQCGSTEN